MIRRLTLLFVSLALVLALVSPAADAAARERGVAVGAVPVTAALVTSYCASAEELAVLNLINQYRAQNGLPGLSLSLTLSKAAEYHSLDMAQYNYFSHNLADGTTWSQNITNHGYTYGTWKGENIAAGHATPQSVFDGWRNSPGHNANMLHPSFTAIGIGLVVQPGTTYTYYWTTTFGGVADQQAVGCDGSVPSTGSGPSAGSGGGSAPTAAPSANTGRSGRPARGTGGGTGGAGSQPTAKPSTAPKPGSGSTPSRPPRTR